MSEAPPLADMTNEEGPPEGDPSSRQETKEADPALIDDAITFLSKSLFEVSNDTNPVKLTLAQLEDDKHMKLESGKWIESVSGKNHTQ